MFSVWVFVKCDSTVLLCWCTFYTSVCGARCIQTALQKYGGMAWFLMVGVWFPFLKIRIAVGVVCFFLRCWFAFIHKPLSHFKLQIFVHYSYYTFTYKWVYACCSWGEWVQATLAVLIFLRLFMAVCSVKPSSGTHILFFTYILVLVHTYNRKNFCFYEH